MHNFLECRCRISSDIVIIHSGVVMVLVGVVIVLVVIVLIDGIVGCQDIVLL